MLCAILLFCTLALSPTVHSLVLARTQATKPLLGTAATFGVLAGSTVTNTGVTVVTGDVGVSPGTAVTGFPPGLISPPGAIHSADAVALKAQSDLTIAYNNAAGQPASLDLTGQDLGNKTLIPGVYHFSSSAQLTGPLTLNGQGDPASVFIFQIGSTLTTASNSSVAPINGAQACNIFWQIGSSATIGTGTTFVGNILALTSITATTGATFNGGLYARNGAVTLDTNTITRSRCAVPTPTPPSTPTPIPSSISTVPPTPTFTATPTSTSTPTLPITPTAVPTPTTQPTSIPIQGNYPPEQNNNNNDNDHNNDNNNQNDHNNDNNNNQNDHNNDNNNNNQNDHNNDNNNNQNDHNNDNNNNNQNDHNNNNNNNQNDHNNGTSNTDHGRSDHSDQQGSPSLPPTGGGPVL
ncbi:MAG: hypothetical protein NVS4B9_14160 [Ktedonobacteraceae bacterium]